MLQMLERDMVRSPVPQNLSEHDIAADRLLLPREQGNDELISGDLPHF